MKTEIPVARMNRPYQREQGAGAENGKPKNYKDLRIWQRGIDLVDLVYSSTTRFPKEELDGLAAQMRRSAVQIPSDVAEGYVRRYAREYTPFLYGALGSCARLDTQMFVSAKRRYLGERDIEALSAIIGEETAMLIGLIKKIQQSVNC